MGRKVTWKPQQPEVSLRCNSKLLLRRRENSLTRKQPAASWEERVSFEVKVALGRWHAIMLT